MNKGWSMYIAVSNTRLLLVLYRNFVADIASASCLDGRGKLRFQFGNRRKCSQRCKNTGRYSPSASEVRCVRDHRVDGGS